MCSFIYLFVGCIDTLEQFILVKFGGVRDRPFFCQVREGLCEYQFILWQVNFWQQYMWKTRIWKWVPLKPSVHTWPVEHPSVLSLFGSFCPEVQGLGALSERAPRAEGKGWGLTSATSPGAPGLLFCFTFKLVFEGRVLLLKTTHCKAQLPWRIRDQRAWWLLLTILKWLLRKSLAFHEKTYSSAPSFHKICVCDPRSMYHFSF